MRINKSLQAVIETPYAFLGIRMHGGELCGIEFIRSSSTLLDPQDAATSAVVRQIRKYLENPHWRFSLPLYTGGTAFQKRVWKALQSIPDGRVQTYGELAALLGTSPRAVGNACRSNPVPVVIPCHRVVASNGLGGFSGKRSGTQIRIKQDLLRHEGIMGLS